MPTQSVTQERDETENRPGQADMRLQQRSCTKTWWTAEPWIPGAVLHLQPCPSPLYVPVLSVVCYPKSLLPTTPLGKAKRYQLLCLGCLSLHSSSHSPGCCKGALRPAEKRAWHCSSWMLGELTCWQSQVVHLAEGAGPDHDSGEPICQQGAEIDWG